MFALLELDIEMDNCWADNRYEWEHPNAAHPCITPGDRRLGLCRKHEKEILGGE